MGEAVRPDNEILDSDSRYYSQDVCSDQEACFKAKLHCDPETEMQKHSSTQRDILRVRSLVNKWSALTQFHRLTQKQGEKVKSTWAIQRKSTARQWHMEQKGISHYWEQEPSWRQKKRFETRILFALSGLRAIYGISRTVLQRQPFVYQLATECALESVFWVHGSHWVNGWHNAF